MWYYNFYKTNEGGVMIRTIASAILTFTIFHVPFSVNAQFPASPDAEEMLSDAYPGKAYSPYASLGFPRRPYWGDTHLHTGLSFDAGAFGNRLGLDDAYKFARGEEVMASSGQPVRLSRPLDFLVISDHSDNMGFFPDLLAGDPAILKDPKGKDWYNRINSGDGVSVALEMIKLFSKGEFPKSIAYDADSKQFKSVWQDIIDAAERYNDPGQFSAIIGFEWTSLALGGNMHRVVMHRDDADKASQVLAYTTTAPLGSIDPMDLWKWMDHYEEKTGGDVLAIAHNGNLSNGIMFPVDAQYTGRTLDEEYVTQRIEKEPVYEVTQIKGDGETHPFLSPDDEFADYGSWDVGNLDLSKPKTDDMLAGEYAREALKQGLALETRLGTNPYKFGMIGSTDSHTGLATAQEDNFFGKHTGYEPSPTRFKHNLMESENGVIEGWKLLASGLAAVWATDNTRKAIFDAFERKEVYATTGSRLGVRFFGGWDFVRHDLNSRLPAVTGYTKGVPMGADLPAATSDAPTFMVYSLRDPIGANLDRIQIIKGWMDGAGDLHEKVYDVAWSGDRESGSDGKLPAVGNTVDVANATFTNTIGASELGTVWTDPEFDPAQKAFYYARVIEIPTPRWTTFDAFRFGIELPEGAPTATQERAYTSPIWYNPEG